MKENKNNSNRKYWFIGGACAFLLIVVLVASYSPWSPYSYWWLDQQPTPTTELTESSVSLSSSIDGETVSGLEYIEFYTPKSSAIFNTWEDIRSISLNFELETRKLAESLTFDLTDYEFVWLKLCPSGYGSGVFNEAWKLLYGGNYDFEYDVTDDPTDLYFNIVDDTMDEITVASHATDGNYTILCDIPHYTTTTAQLHVGTGWSMTSSAFDDLTSSQKEDYYDEAKWCSYDPLYVATDDAMPDQPRYDIEFFTDCPAFKFIFNATAGSVNFTLNSNVDAVIIADGVNIYVVFYEPLAFLNGIQSFAYEIQYPQLGSPSDVELSDVDFGRATVTRGASIAPTTFTKVADIAS
ncbi:MAG: hypothetical protein ACFFDF_01000 [Candidatus Odinarchaeota archaeon]